MMKKFTLSLIQILLVSVLLAGIFMLWASLQSFETLASLMNRLASDGELESFTVNIYQTMRMPFALAGVIVTLAGFALLRWRKTEIWLSELPSQVGRFFSLLRKDSQRFGTEARLAIKSEGWKGIAVLASLMGIALVMRLGDLNLPLTHDEAYMYNAFASRSIGHMVSNYHLPNNHVFLSIVINLTTRLLGNAVWALRIPTILAGVFTVPAIYWLAKRFYSRETALLNAALVPVIPVFIKYSVYARGYAFIILFTILILAFGDYVRVKKNRFAWLLIVIFSALGFFTIPIMLFPFGALYIWLIVSLLFGDVYSYETKFDFLKYWISSGFITAFITVLLYLPIILNNSDRFFGNGFIAPLEWSIFLETLSTRLRNTWIEWAESIPLWMSLLAVLGFVVSLIFHKRFSRQKFPPQFAFFIWIVVMLVARRPDMLPRFWLFLAGPLLIWSLAGIIEPLKRIPVKFGKGWNLAQVFVSVIVVLIVVQGLITIPSLPTRWADKDDMELSTIYLQDRLQEGDLVTASVARSPAMRYYFNFYEIPRGYIREAGSFQRAFIIVDSEKGETLRSVAPKLGYDIPAIDMDTARELVRFDYLTIYECYPLQ